MPPNEIAAYNYTTYRLEGGEEILELTGIPTAEEAIEEAWNSHSLTGAVLVVRGPDGRSLGLAGRVCSLSGGGR